MLFRCPKLVIFTLNVAAILAGTVACSQQWRESNPNVNNADLQAIITDALTGGNVGDSGAARSQAQAIFQDQAATTVYFNDGPRRGARMSAAFSYKSLAFLLPPEALKNGPIVGARVLYFDHSGDHQSVLIVGVIQNGSSDSPDRDEARSNFTYYSFQGRGVIKNNEYKMTFQGADGNPYTLRSYDVRGNNLRATIQLEVLARGQSPAVAKFPSLAGYR